MASDSLHCGRILGGRKLLVYNNPLPLARSLPFAQFPPICWSFNTALSRAKTFVRLKKTPALYVTIDNNI